jgi:hypothetical protein
MESNERWVYASRQGHVLLRVHAVEGDRDFTAKIFVAEQNSVRAKIVPGNTMTNCRRPRNCFRYFTLFSLFGSIWKHLNTDWFRYFAPF